ncbi:hypothetical protein [Streptomyces alfalfae]
MPARIRPDGPYCPAREEVNDRIRVLMSQPASDARSEEWARLLRLWTDGCCPPCGCCRAAPVAA